MHIPIYPGQHIDIHTHKPTADNTIAVESRHERFDNLEENGIYSLGIHPWFISNPPLQLKQLKYYGSVPGVIAIGECGLDRVCTADFSLQQQVFRQQILLANEIKKPLIIHCVRAFPETLGLLKEAEVPVIFHGFNKKQAVADMLLQNGYYLSFGKSLLQEHSFIAGVFASTPPELFFLETDNSADTIATIYKAAAKIRKTSEDDIILQIQNNFKKVFG